MEHAIFLKPITIEYALRKGLSKIIVPVFPALNQAGPYKEGDTLWVKESWAKCPDTCRNSKNFAAMKTCTVHPLAYRAGSRERRTDWIPSVRMPKWAARLSYKVEGEPVKKHLHDLTRKEIRSQGVMLPPSARHTADDSFSELQKEFFDHWDSVHKKVFPSASNPDVRIFEVWQTLRAIFLP